MIYTEEMKQVIESHGMRVIDYKQGVKDGSVFPYFIRNQFLFAIREGIVKRSIR